MESKYWLFTINKRDDDEYGIAFSTIYVPDMVPDEYDYLVYQLEHKGNLHYQGYICLKKKKKLSALRNQHPGVHWGDQNGKPRMGTHSEAKKYVTKTDETYVWGPWEHGCDDDIPEGKGERRDMLEVRKMILEGKSEEDIKAEHYGTWVRYYKAFQLDMRHQKEKSVKSRLDDENKSVTLSGWQIPLLAKLEQQDSRTVTWVWSKNGKMGKTAMAKWLEFNKKAFIVKGGKHQDIAHTYNYQDWVVFDYPKLIDATKIPYAFIETFKDGYVFSGKFDSVMKRIPVPKILVLSNHPPQLESLSRDRWQIYNIDVLGTDITPVVTTRHKRIFPKTGLREVNGTVQQLVEWSEFLEDGIDIPEEFNINDIE